MSVQIKFQVSIPPFRWDEAGGIRIGNSRVTLDSLLATCRDRPVRIRIRLLTNIK
ncbi:MAG: hypothetical protein ACFKPT_04325 [Gloeotrichia echinulata GP01]